MSDAREVHILVYTCSRLPTWGRGPALLVDEEMEEEEDVEISDDDEPMPLLTTRRRRGTNARSSRGVLPMLSPDGCSVLFEGTGVVYFVHVRH